jgi:putative membrane protein
MNTLAALAIVCGAGLILGACERGGARVVDEVEDAVSVPVGQTSARTAGSNLVSAYISNAYMGDLYGIQAANIALERSVDERVRAFAQGLRAQQSTSRTNLAATAASEAPATKLPGWLDQRRSGLIENLRTASAADFDKVYLDQQIAALEEAQTLNRGFADHADSPGLLKHALGAVPDDQARLRQARQLRASL